MWPEEARRSATSWTETYAFCKSKCTKQFELDTEVEDIVTQLKDIHGDNFTAPQLRMWAHYVKAGHYKDLVELGNWKQEMVVNAKV